MRSTLALVALLLATAAFAGDAQHRQTGLLLQMDTVQCAAERDSADSASKAGVVVASSPNSIEGSFCQEYVLQSDRVTFHIRPRDPKHAVLLPVGGIAQFRLREDIMVLRAADLDDRDREYTVVSMSPRETPKPPDTPLPKLNHLQ